MNGEKPAFIQIIEMLEDSILSGIYAADDLIISTPQISKLMSVNPATAQRAISVMTDHGLIYKKRGVGMAVTQDARRMILEQRRKAFFEKVTPEYISSAGKIGIGGDELINIIKDNLKDDLKYDLKANRKEGNQNG